MTKEKIIKTEKIIKSEVVEKEPVSKHQTKMYIGPTIEKEGLMNGQVFIGSLDKRIELLFKKYKTLKKLFVEVDNNLSIKKINVMKQGTYENVCYLKVIEDIKEGR